VAFSSPSAVVRHRFERRSRRLEVAREVRESLVSLAGLVGRGGQTRHGPHPNGDGGGGDAHAANRRMWWSRTNRS
jgi:hypothetical protein